MVTVSTSRVVMEMLRSHKLLQMEIDLLAVHADIGDDAARRDDLFAQLESGRNANRFDGGIDAAAAGHLHDRLDGLAVRAVDGRGGAEALRHFKAIIVEIDHDDLGRRVKLRGQQGGKPDRPGADDRDGAPRLNLAVEHAAFEAGRQDVAQHHQRLFVGAAGNGIEAGIRVGNADELGLRAVDGVAENPAAGGAVRVHLLAAIIAFAAGA